ncbi:Uncharacterized protein TCAP_05629 [Tolypocladium capitatum]|uniref:Extracellular serine-rich protein n=1 Tax=Tolypocladium capitatum TaxID=45235 RepID=A0A2K3QA40_9HYPO|nr:Uncharacterized protein TCAP_05629 [Tolypocladium capitatum]
MLFTSLKVAVLSLLAANAAAKTIQINAGGNGKDFSPSSVTAAKGDVIEFHFLKSLHNVAAGDFAKACSPLTTGGFYSGFIQPKSGGPTVFQVTVNSTDPIFYYCSVGNHCQDGMVGVVNPTSNLTLDKYASSAKSASSNISPDALYGGKLIQASDVTASASSTASSSPSSTSGNGASSTTGNSPTQTKATGAAGQLSVSLLAIAGVAAGAAAFAM